MKLKTEAEIKKVLSSLIDSPVCIIGRASDLLWIHFGKLEMDAEAGKRGLEIASTIGDWALHIQCPWRFVKNKKIILSWRDFNLTPDTEIMDGWDSGGTSRFDSMAEKVNSFLLKNDVIVKKIVLDEVGGFKMMMTDDLSLEVFPDLSFVNEQTEIWRIFQPKLRTEHFVVG